MAGTTLHLVTIVVSAAATAALALWVPRRVLAGLVLTFWVAVQAYQLWPSQFHWRTSLPLHVCDVANLIGPAALWFRWRWARTLAVFWGVGLTTQGFITPAISSGPGSLLFWGFWLNHVFALATAVHELVRGGYRPGWRDTVTAIGLSAIYVAAMFTLDVLTGWNYGYVGPDRPGAPTTAANLLGPWPWRVLWMSGVVAAWFALLGWGLGKIRSEKSQA